MLPMAAPASDSVPSATAALDGGQSSARRAPCERHERCPATKRFDCARRRRVDAADHLPLGASSAHLAASRPGTDLDHLRGRASTYCRTGKVSHLDWYASAAARTGWRTVTAIKRHASSEQARRPACSRRKTSTWHPAFGTGVFQAGQQRQRRGLSEGWRARECHRAHTRRRPCWRHPLPPNASRCHVNGASWVGGDATRRQATAFSPGDRCS